jgi:hypothetical protein
VVASTTRAAVAEDSIGVRWMYGAIVSAASTIRATLTMRPSLSARSKLGAAMAAA